MKKIKLNTARLQLNKERISSLTNDEMGHVNGGFTSIFNCNTSTNQPTTTTVPHEPLSCANNETNICGATSNGGTVSQIPTTKP